MLPLISLWAENIISNPSAYFVPLLKRQQSMTMRAAAFGRAGVLALLAVASAETTREPCPVLGPSFPKPSTLSTDKAFQAGVKAFDTAMEQSLRNGSTLKEIPIPFNTTTFSIGMFSTFREGLLHEYHYTGPDVIQSSEGVHKVDSDSIYRLASITKPLTAYVFLIREGFARFEDPITRYIPELRVDAENLTSANGILPDWNDIHLGDLICHTAGIAEDCK
jgi:Beta-lactamase